MRELVSQFARFTVVGLGGLVVDWGVSNLLWTTVFVEGRVDHPHALGKLVSTILAIIVNWLGNRYWAFRAERRKEAVAEAVEFFVVSGVGSIFPFICLWVSVDVLGYTSLLADNISANVIGLALGTAFRFVFYKIWVFRKGRGTPVDAVNEARREGGDVTPATTLVVIPTYNERESLPTQIAALFAAAPDVHLLIVDDSSPDGTGALADEFAAGNDQIQVLHRTVKDGLGRAYLAGFALGIEQGYSALVEMDADGSHPASALPVMLERLAEDRELGVVIGSRYVEGGSTDPRWPGHRRWLSRTANAYARFMLGVPVADVTAGYRAYRAEVLAEIGDVVRSRGYAFQVDMTVRTYDAGWRLAEVPIAFKDRESGVSKMSGGVIVEAMLLVTRWGLGRLFSGR